MRPVPLLVYVGAVLALFATPWRLGPGHARPLPAAEAAAPLGAGTFQPNAVYPSTAENPVLRDVGTRGSWLGGDAFQGRYETGWYRAERDFTVMVAGYPTVAGNRLELIVRRRDGALRIYPFSGPDSGETWLPWTVQLPGDAMALRVRAIDGSSKSRGWLAFSEPFNIPDRASRQVWGLVQLLASTCLALTLVYGPGLIWLGKRERAAGDITLAIFAGPLLLAGLGVACWLLGGWIAPVTVARIGVVVLLGGIGWGAWRTRKTFHLPRESRTVVFAGALLVGFAVAKANYSGGPAGELFGGTISRTLEVGGHSDSRISYHVVQVVANRLRPFEPEAEKFFSPWSFASRGPLSGLAAAPVVLATGATVPLDQPDQPWAPFDRQGFAVYRIAMIALASLVGWAVFGVTARLLTAQWGFVAAVVTLLSPFFPHELYFTWPKLVTAAFVLASFYLTLQRRPFAAGLALGGGYLFHPLALLSVPFLGLWLLVTSGARAPRLPLDWKRWRPPLLFALAAGLCVAPWSALGSLADSSAGSQSVFLTYFRLADNHLTDWPTWWRTRCDNFSNTFIPFHLLTIDPTHESINSVYGPSDKWVHAGFLYWNTLPFALGLPAFALIMAGVFAATRRARDIVLLLWAAPTFFLIVYWGAACTGLMRHCGQVLFVSTIVLGVWGLPGGEAWKRRALAAFLHPAMFVWRGAEILAMAFGTTLLNQRPQLHGAFGLNDVFSLAAAVVCVAGASFMLARQSRGLCLFPDHPAARGHA